MDVSFYYSTIEARLVAASGKNRTIVPDQPPDQNHFATLSTATGASTGNGAVQRSAPVMFDFVSDASVLCASVKSDTYCFVLQPIILNHRSRLPATLVAAQHAK
jgi:hypothetical protein